MEWHPTVTHVASMDGGVFEYPIYDAEDADEEGDQAGECGNEIGLSCPSYLLAFSWR